MSDWTAHAAELTRSISAAAPIRDRRWLAAVEQVPRHLFVPRWYERSPTGWVTAGIAPPAAPDPAAAAEAAGDDAAATDPTGGSAIGRAVGADP